MNSIEWLIQVFAHNDIIDHKLLSSREDKYELYKRLSKQAKEMYNREIDNAKLDGYGNGYTEGCWDADNK